MYLMSKRADGQDVRAVGKVEPGGQQETRGFSLTRAFYVGLKLKF